MSLIFENPAWLWPIALSAPLALIAARWFSSMSGPRRWTAAVIRAVVIALLCAMLAGASSIRRTERLTVIGVVDVSESVRLFGVGPGGRDALSAAQDFLAAAEKERGPDDMLGVVAFDARSIAVAMPTRGEIAHRAIDVRLAEGTDIAGALRYAAALVPADSSGRIVLISDGVQTSGDALSVAKEVAGRVGARMPIDVVPVQLNATQEVVVESLDVPPQAASEASVTARVTLFVTSPTRGTLQLLREGETLDINGAQPGTGRRLELPAGRHVELVTVALPLGKLHRFTAVFVPDESSPGRLVGDTRVENNRADGVTITPGKGSVLLVDGVDVPGGPGGGGILARTLKEAGIDVTVIAPEALPEDIIGYTSYDLVVFENVPAELVPPDKQRALVAHVRDMGGGFVMVGGPDSLGAGGWKGSDVEPILPVKLDLPEQLIQPDAAVLLVMDNSGSMSRSVLGSIHSQQEIANQSAALAVRTLTKKDLVGVIIFNTDFSVVRELGPNDDPQRTAERILAISPGGGTNMVPALEEAGRQMTEVKAAVKHIIVLSDGRSLGHEQLPAIAEQIRMRSGAKVSTIGVGDAADEQTMAQIAERGGGKSFMVSNPNQLPKFFLKAVRVIRTPAVREAAFQPVVSSVPSPLSLGISSPPKLLGLVITQRRPESTISYAMSADSGEPLLAHWNVELGKAAVFASDASRWAAPWLDWSGYRQMWVQVARSMARALKQSEFDFKVDVDGGKLKMVLDAATSQGKPVDQLEIPVTVNMPGSGGKEVQVALAQTAPGIYQAEIPARESGTYIVRALPRLNGSRLPPLIAGATVSHGVEFARLTTDRALLEEIARNSRGRLLSLESPKTAQLFDRSIVEPREARTNLWRVLIFWVLGAFLLDVATRRIAWDRFVSKEYGVDLRRAAAESVQDRGGKAAKVVERLREAPKKVEDEQARTIAIQLSAEDAERVAEAEAERRRQARLAMVQSLRERQQSEQIVESADEGGSAPHRTPPVTKPVTPPAESKQPDAGETGLMAAKRRARQRLEGNGEEA